MKLVLVRDVLASNYTLGALTLDGKHFAYTCEDTDRRLEDGKSEKVAAQTAIPRGTYSVVLSFSHRFQKVLPEVLDVPLFKGIRFHGGNSAADTEGCVLIGASRIAGGCANCAPVLERLIVLMEGAEANGEITTLTVS